MLPAVRPVGRFHEKGTLCQKENTRRGEVIRLSKVIYGERIRHKMTEEDFGLFVAIEVESGDYETDWRISDALHRLRERNPDGAITAQRVGYSTPLSMGYHEEPSLDKPTIEVMALKRKPVD